jgi:Ribbon-helix-helix protein, copG family
MKTTAKASREAMVRRHESPDYDAFGERGGKRAEPVQNTGVPPVSIRLSRPLLDAIDHLAARQHRTRSNLIQHVLWEFVHAQMGGTVTSRRVPGERR